MKKKINKTALDPKIFEYKTYKIYIEQEQIDIQKLKTSFLPNLTHSIENGFLRIFL
jgi:hypothetical protein